MESKLNRLKNAWDQFAMGIANSEIIKVGVDLLTDLLNAINKITDSGSSGFGGIVTSILRLSTVLLGLKAGNAVFQSFTRNLRNLSGGSGGFQGFDIFGAFKATGGDMKAGIKRFGNDILGVIEIIKDPAWRGEGLKEIGKAVGGAKGKILQLVGALTKALPILLAIAAAIALITKIVKDFNAA
jgi:hypothetical protein